ncbi:S1 RNA-binding domain-containing protein 1 [Pseudonaja textilis]|uniref:S1 RNA-binding domain-containing protein 1 n=1 Tax=Pseudonaja textilis TaxID=8673 RepID=UPI000EA9FA7E|nr:S1 RNA-binding domain-containing protein 1 [Pseudonaja textilis]
MSAVSKRKRTAVKLDISKDELPSFLKSSSESEDEQYEEEWVPKKEVSHKAKVPKPKVPRVEKKSVTKKKPTVAKKGTKKLAIKEDPDLPLPIAIPGETEKKTEEDVTMRCSTKKPAVKKVGGIKGESGSVNEDEPSTSAAVSKKKIKMEESEEDFTFDEPPLKKFKTGCPQEKSVKYVAGDKLNGDHNMNWDIVEVLSQRTDIEAWVCANIIKLFNDDNTIPFIVRYRKELINNLEADVLREVQQIMEELQTLAKKVHVSIQKLEKEGKLSESVLTSLLNCKTLEELDHVYAPYKTGSKGTKAQRAKQLGLEQAANLLIENPKELNLLFYVKSNVEGLSTIEEVKSGVQHILADMVAKDKETLDFIRNLCQRKYICIQSSLTKVTSKNINEKNVNKFHLYQNFSCNIKSIHHHQVLHTDIVYLHAGKGIHEAQKIRKLLLDHNCFTIVIGNGTACRETEAYFADLIMKKYFAPLDVTYCITNEAGASIYSVSPEACKEMPDLDPNLRSAVSIARRVQDPLAELVKIEPKHIGIGMYQHDVSQTLLKATLDSVVEECVSFVGVDINICSETLLRHIAGLNANRAKNIIEWRQKNGPFINREQLKDVKGLGPKSFQQCAGFIRINQEYIRSFCSQQNELAAGSHKAVTNEKQCKKKTKAAANVIRQPNPLDQTCIHPESYNIAMRFLTLVGESHCDIGKPKMQQKVNSIIEREGMDGITRKLNTTEQTLQIIIDALTQPESFDIRKDFDQPDFKKSIVCPEDLRVGTILTGRVENATLFGVFVDIGVGKTALIPIRSITEDKLSKAKKRRSLGLGPGEKVEVRVREIDLPRSRITLELIRVL